MVHLPVEIHKIIVDELAKFTERRSEVKTEEARLRGTDNDREKLTPALAQYATVSKVWQSLIEPHTFKSLTITSEEVSCLGSIVMKRIALVRHLKYEVLLPEYDLATLNEEETLPPAQVNSEVFSHAIKDLFEELANVTVVSCRDLRLELSSHSPSDYLWNDIDIDIDSDTGTDSYTELEEASSFHNLRCELSHFQFLPDDVGAIPMVRIITELDTFQSDQRPLHPASSCTLTSYLPSLRTWAGKFADGNLDDPDKSVEDRREMREAFGRNLVHLPPSIRSCYFYYNCDYDGIKDPGTPAPRLTSSSGQDALSCGIHLLSQRLQYLTLSCCTIGLDFFWPKQSLPELPLWPNLKFIDLSIRPVLADGSWLYGKGLIYPTDSDDPEDGGPHVELAHYKPNASLFDRLYLNAALAAAQMPNLEFFHIMSSDTKDPYGSDKNPPYFPWLSFFFVADRDTDRYIEWNIPSAYQPSPEVIDAWKVAKGADIRVEIMTNLP